MYRDEGAAGGGRALPIGQSPNKLRLKEKNCKRIQRLEEQYAKNDKLKEELVKMKQKLQPTPSAPVATAPGPTVKQAHAEVQTVNHGCGLMGKEMTTMTAAAAAEAITAEPMTLASIQRDRWKENRQKEK